MTRKYVIKYIEIYNNKGPRIGEIVKYYFRNVTHLAKDLSNQFSTSLRIKEAWQYLGMSFQEYTKQEIRNMLKLALSQLTDTELDTYDNPVVVVFENNSIIQFYDYDDQKELPEFVLSEECIRI
jgi:hypothetical protein